MKTADLEIFRTRLLQQLAEAGDHGLAVPVLLTGAQLAGFEKADAETVRCELTYLADKGLVLSVAKLLSPENKRWRVTAAGRDHLAEQGLA